MTETQIAWAAGLFEGEGTWYVRPPRGHGRFPNIGIALSMADRDVVERFAEIMDCGHLYHLRRSETNPRHKDQWRWETGRRADAFRIATMFLPHLGERRASRASEIIALIRQIESETLKRRVPAA